MSSTRNKRKRTETDSRAKGKPKSREQRDAAVGNGKKNEVLIPKPAVTTNAHKTTQGTSNEVDSSTVATRQQQAIALDASAKARGATEGDSSVQIPSKSSNINNSGYLSPNVTSATKPQNSREAASSSDPSENGLHAHETSRSARLQGLISHRSSLRTRIRYCAAAASERLRQREAIGESGDSKLEISAQKASDKEEISVFREMANSATIAAKRIRADSDANSDRRTSLSLRRGSSVGKRMNAALSSLAPGSSSNHASSNLATVESNSDSNSITKVPVNERENDLVGSNVAEIPQLSSILSAQPTLPSSNGLKQQTSSANVYSQGIPTPNQLKLSKKDQPEGPETKLEDENNSACNEAELNSKVSETHEANNRQSSSTDSDRLALPMHFGAKTESLPQNRLTGRAMFSTKTSVLRKQRDAIEARLSVYREETQQNALVLPTKSKSMKHRLLSHHKSVSLPNRNVTHWDVLLQEMSWMATDFIEERKWKESASRSISSAIASSSETYPNSTPVLADDSRKRPEASPQDVAQSVHKNTQADAGIENKLESLSTCTKLKEMATQTYPGNNSLEGTAGTRKVGKNIALLIGALVSTLVGTIEKKESDHNHNQDPNFSHQNNRNLSDASRRKHRLRLLLPQKGSSFSSGLRATLNSQNSFSSVEISGYVDTFAKLKRQRNGSLFQSDALHSDSSCKVSLSREQKDVVDRVVNMWNQPTKPGIALCGAPFCGKTYVASVLLWERRKQGPQLLICPTHSMIKWKHAIERLGDIRVLSYTFSGHLNTDLSEDGAVSLKASDIVICEFELLECVAGVLSSDNSFQTILVDCRYPWSYLASIGKPSLGIAASTGEGSCDGSSELLSVPWWDKLLDLSLQSSAAILLVEHTSGNNWLHNLANLSQRTKLEITASRAALLIGPRLFLSSGERMQQRLFSWARQHGKVERRRKSATAREVVEKATACLNISLVSSSRPAEKMGLEVRRCKMDVVQRSNYDACCIGVRGALSRALAALVARNHDSLRSVSQSLMLLRHQCIHAEVIGQSSNDCTHFAGQKRSHTRISNPTGRIATENPAQLDSALATRLIEGSGKLREMMSILGFECGVSLPEKLLLGCNFPKQKVASAEEKPRKVVILATLPIARRIISLLLNALGIQHELLEPTLFQCPDKSSLSSTNAPTNASIFSSQRQHMSSYFNSKRRHASSFHSPNNIVVTSPVCLSGWNQGLVVENSDTVIIVDDDWTGRGDFVLSALLSRMQARSFHTRKRCNFIRLICEATIEDKLYSNYASELSFVESTQWPRDKYGLITFPATISEALRLYRSASRSDTREARGFPLFRVIRLRHQLLSKTLLPSRPIPVVLGSTSKNRFLPFAKVDDRTDDCEIYAELSLIRILCHEESVASACCCSFELARKKNKHFCLPPSHQSSVTQPLITNRQNFLVLSYLCNLVVANLQWFETTLVQGLKILQFSFDKSRHAATVCAVHCTASEKPKPSRSPLFGCLRTSIKSPSGPLVLYYAPKLQHQEEITSHRETDDGFYLESSMGTMNRSIALQPRRNCYSNLYATSHIGNKSFAGYDGFEPLLFSPPLLKEEMKEEIRRGVSKCGQVQTSEVSKRKGTSISSLELPDSKRVRQMEPSSAISRHADDAKSSLGSKPVHFNSSMEESVELQYPNSLPTRPTLAEVLEGRARGSASDKRTATHGCTSYMINRLDKTVVSRERQVFPVYDSTSVENLLQHSSRKSESFLDSVLLFVENPGMQNPGSVAVTRYNSNHPRHFVDPQLPPLAPGGVPAAEDEENRNKKKGNEKVSQPQIALQVPIVQGSNAGQAHAALASEGLKKHGHRHRLYDFFVSRSMGSGLSMFECVLYQAVVWQVEAQIARMLEKPELYLGGKREIWVPHQQIDSDLSNTQNGRKGRKFVEGPLNLANTREVPSMQALKKSKSTGSGVVGQWSGFLSSPKGMNAPSVPKQQLGMSLPMGVKVSQAREEAQHSAWSRNVTCLLCDMVERYGQNWILIAKMMQQILKAEIAKVQYHRKSENLWWKSADNCQRLWESICGTDELNSTQKDVVGHKRRVRSTRHISCCQKPSQETPCHSMLGLRDSIVLVGRMCMTKGLGRSKQGHHSSVVVEHQTSINVKQTASQRNPNVFFSSFITSNAQRRLMPIAIIGVGNGPKQNQTAHSHPSHLQSVQESVTSHWSDGRTELWPLQIIDAAEKQHAATRAPSASAKPSSHSLVSASTSPPAGRGHPYPRAPGNATTASRSGSKSQASRISGANNMVAASHASIAPKKSIPPNGLARISGQSNSRSK